VIISLMLSVPKMEVFSTGQGVMAKESGTVSLVTDTRITVGDRSYPLQPKTSGFEDLDDKLLVFPTKETWQESTVETGQQVQKKELLAKGVTRIYFQANVWIFAVLVILLGAIWGIGKAAVYKHIPDYFPDEVGVVGGMVGVLGGLGGFVCPIIFGYLLEWTGLWTSAWMFMFAVSLLCLYWMHHTIMKSIELPFDMESKFVGLLKADDGSLLSPLLSWNESFRTGCEEIDRQHRHMMRLINEMDLAVKSNASFESIEPIVDELVEYTQKHFANEEHILESNQCPGLEKHKNAHVHLMKELLDWREKAKLCNAEKIQELMAFLRIWFPGHILGVDKKHAEFLKS